MGLGHDHYMKIIEELNKKGVWLSREEIQELKLIANKIDEVYQQILDNQTAFGTPRITVKDAVNETD